MRDAPPPLLLRDVIGDLAVVVELLTRRAPYSPLGGWYSPGADPHGCVSMSSHIHKGQVRRKLGIGKLPRFFCVPRLHVLDARSNPMTKEHVDRREGLVGAGSIEQKQRPQGVVLTRWRPSLRRAAPPPPTPLPGSARLPFRPSAARATALQRDWIAASV